VLGAVCAHAAQGVRVLLDGATEVPHTFEVDALRLRQARAAHALPICFRKFSLYSHFSAQIVMNALTNAVKHTPHAASEAISVTVRVDASRKFVIEVADRGPGLRGQTLEELKAEFGGGSGGDFVAWQPLGAIRSSGMGIPICVRLAER
jgi:Histidine kinase-, DNA gyrase B-, and HSP90-like ATPase